MPDDIRNAWVIAVGTYEGGEFDYVGNAWAKKD